ncbi:DUF6953 family protein [Paenibacillus sp. sgz302251]|uniref:DUF6953 family protein n=1 Tax=Paenibacillus sp. sgz302251 TaxID=3414493 RepID=UPI003C7E3723
MSHTAEDVAQWMLNEVKDKGILHQSAAVEYIRSHYGESFIYVNEHGNQSIDKEVKKIFRKLHRGRAAWERDGFFWGWS